MRHFLFVIMLLAVPLIVAPPLIAIVVVISVPAALIAGVAAICFPTDVGSPVTMAAQNANVVTVRR